MKKSPPERAFLFMGLLATAVVALAALQVALD
jgi:hypothetical protein